MRTRYDYRSRYSRMSLEELQQAEKILINKISRYHLITDSVRRLMKEHSYVQLKIKQK